MTMHHFLAQNGPFTRNKFLFSKIITIIFIYLLAPFIVQNFKTEIRDNNKWKYSSNPKGILKPEKKLWNSTPSELPQLLLLNLFAKFLTERKYLMNTLIFVRLKYL